MLLDLAWSMSTEGALFWGLASVSGQLDPTPSQCGRLMKEDHAQVTLGCNAPVWGHKVGVKADPGAVELGP